MSFIRADLGVSSSVVAGVTDRLGGSSTAPYGSFNLGANVGDDTGNVALNRRQFAKQLHVDVKQCQWLDQVHGDHVVLATLGTLGTVPKADAVITRERGLVISVLTADCLPLLISNKEGTEVAAVHAGWRSLAAGIIENTIAAMESPSEDLVAWFGPAIGPNQFEVGEDVKEAFALSSGKDAVKVFKPIEDKEWKYLADIYALAKIRLKTLGVKYIARASYCTVEQTQWYSYRRDGKTGRMASFIMIL